MWSLEGRVALITGANGGIGRELCQVLESCGAIVLRTDLVIPDQADRTSQHWFACDVTKESEVELLFEWVESGWDHVDILVNNAGLLRTAPVAKTTAALWDAVFAVNAFGPFITTRQALPKMRAAGFGRIVTIASSAGLTGGSAETAAYGASKAAAIAFTRAVAREAARDGVTANSIAPYVIETAMIADVPGMDERIAQIPVGRSGTPRDVAAAVAYLCSAEAGYVTGETLRLTGGFIP